MKRVNRETILLGIILIFAVSVRIWGVNYDLPYIYHPDEPHNVTISQNMFKTGDLNPHFFHYPSLFYYINAIAYVPYFLFGKLLGVFTTRSDILLPVSLVMGTTISPMPTTILWGRLITIIFDVGTVGLAFLIGKQLTGNSTVGLLASLLILVSPDNVTNSRFVTPDAFLSFFTAASFFAAVLVYQQGKTRHYIMAGLLIGFTASIKYNGAVIILPFLLAHFLRYKKTALKERKLYLALFASGLGFLATTPFALLDYPKFIADLGFSALHYSTSHAGMEGNTLRWYVNHMWQTAGIVYILAALGLLHGLYVRSKEVILLSIFPIAYFWLISSLVVRNDRTFLPLVLFLFLLAASFLTHLLSKANEVQSKTLRRMSILAVVCLILASFILPTTKVITDTIRLTTTDGRETARVWINNNLPPGAKIAIESYSPYVEPEKFSVYGVGQMIDYKPEWYVENGFDYLVFSLGMYGRFYLEPERYGAQIAQYDDFFNRFTLTKTFSDGGYEIRIYATDTHTRQ